MEPPSPPLTPSPDNNILNFKKKKPYKSLEGKHVKSATWRKQMNYLSVLAEKWFQPCYELRGCWTPHWIFLSFFSPLSIPLISLSLSLPLHMNSEESTLHTGKLLIHGGTTGELFVVDWSRGVDSAVSDHESRGNLCCFSLFLCLICVLKQGFFVYWYNPPPSFPKNVCVSTYSNKAFLCIKSFWVKF